MPKMYYDVTLNLKQMVLTASENAKYGVAGAEEVARENQNALDLYLDLMKKFPLFEWVEKTTEEGIFPDLRYHQPHHEIPYILRDRLGNPSEHD